MVSVMMFGRKSTLFWLGIYCLLFATPSFGQARCRAFEAYKSEGNELWQVGSRLEQALRQRASGNKADSCEEAKAFNAKVEGYVAKRSKVDSTCYFDEGVTILGDDRIDAKQYAARMLTAYCGIATTPAERGTSPAAGSDWSYRGRILIPVGLIIVVVLFVARAILRR